ncbi:NAD(P)-dependent oxidoreductase [Acrocarpospora catenulata]|uniref:NAD(P)-dependent oxidoreductase n=1 Tax=Acrocarpospora catenulata TaxID=2836182 RepID=UPI001BDA54EC|nr:NAD(P)H-binding protein [Acrocarpospora catenulata]
MAKIIIFGAGGRAGRAIVQEARRRGHEVTAAVRNPANHADLATEGVHVTTADVTDPASIAALAPGHTAAVSTVYDPATGPETFFANTAQALIEALPKAGVPRLLVVGLASILPTESGELLMDTPDYPQEYRTFYLGHAAGTTTLHTATPSLDWLVLSPSGDFAYNAPRTGTYRVAPAAADSRISHPDFAIAVLDEIDTPTHHHTHIGVETLP